MQRKDPGCSVSLDFIKMQSCGNDFIVVDLRGGGALPEADEVRRMCDRHFGIGADQLLVVSSTQTPGADFSAIVFNADGSRAGQCGNGMRCLARYVFREARYRQYGVRFALNDRIVSANAYADGRICVNMRSPCLEPEGVPVRMPDGPVPLMLMRPGAQAFAVGMGNPHAVCFSEQMPQGDLRDLAEPWQTDERFPEGVNVEFVTADARHSTLHLRVYERGAGETLACGSGACAAAVAGILTGRVHSPVNVVMPGGNVTVIWRGPGSEVYLVGSAETVFEGRWLRVGRSV